MVKLWRITAGRYADTAFSGLGSEEFGGRFNSPGRKVVYTSGYLSLAMLELLVQAGDRSRLRDHVYRSTDVRERDILRMQVADLPEGWRAAPSRAASHTVGDAWLDRGESLVLGVPSAVVPIEWNYLINPAHPRFAELVFSEPCLAEFDPRLVQG